MEMNLQQKSAVLVLFGMFVATSFAADKATQDLYVAKCAKCHGTDGVATVVGKRLFAKDFSDPEVAKMSDKDMIDATTNGKGKMPAYGKSLKEDQIKSLVDYIRSMTKKGK
jgi:mono/diheme cytochrome c family protein